MEEDCARRQYSKRLGTHGYREKDNAIFTGNAVHQKAAELTHEADLAATSYPGSIDTHIEIPTKLIEYTAARKIIVASQHRLVERWAKTPYSMMLRALPPFLEALEKAAACIGKSQRLTQKVREIATVFDEKTVREKVKTLYMSL